MVERDEKTESSPPNAKLDAVERERRQSRRVGFIVLGVLCVTMPTLWVVQLIRRSNAEKSGEVAVAQRAKEDEGTVEYQNEISIAPPNRAHPSRHEVAFSIGAVLPEAKSCMQDIYGTAFATWRVNPDGSASDVHFESAAPGLDVEKLWGSTCLSETIRKARVAPFDGEPVTVRYPFRNMPSAGQMKAAADLIMGKVPADGGARAIVLTPAGSGAP